MINDIANVTVVTSTIAGEWTGDWSDHDPRWTAELQVAAVIPTSHE